MDYFKLMSKTTNARFVILRMVWLTFSSQKMNPLNRNHYSTLLLLHPCNKLIITIKNVTISSTAIVDEKVKTK